MTDLEKACEAIYKTGKNWGRHKFHECVLAKLLVGANKNGLDGKWIYNIDQIGKLLKEVQEELTKELGE